MTYAKSARFDICCAPLWQFDGYKDDAATGETFKTSYGVTEYTWSTAWNKGIVDKPFSEATEADCRMILDVMFFQAASCDKMPVGVDLVVFNDAMGCGEGHAARLVQRIVGTTQDGAIGPITLLALKGMGVKPFIDAMVAADEKYFASLANAPMYLKGWDRREEFVKATAYQMAGIEASPVVA